MVTEVRKYEQAAVKDILKNILFSSIIYYIGYLNFSITWAILLSLLNVLNKERKRIWDSRTQFVRKSDDGKEKDVILDNVQDLPAWVFFPDVERAEWINKIIKQFWPNINYYVRDILKDSAEIALRKNLQGYGLRGFTFERIVLGNVPFRTGGIIVYENVSRDEIVMDIDVTYAGDCDIKFRISRLKGGIKNFQLFGNLRVVLKPLIPTLPLVGGVQIFFLNAPEIDFELDGIVGVLEFPGLSDCLRKCVKDTLASMIVLPNKFPIVLTKEISSEKLKTPNPVGVLRIHIIEAKNLLKKDLTITGKGKSDPYAVLAVGEQTFKTEAIKNNVNPKWDSWAEFVVLDYNGQELQMTIWDEDQTVDEFLGRASVEISALKLAGQSDMWLTLEEVKHGKVHIRSTWLTLSNNYEDLKSAIYETQQLQVPNMNSALLIAFIDSATNLKQVKASTKPDTYVQLQLDKQVNSTNIIKRSINPVWEEGIILFINNPEEDCLNIKIVDAKTETDLYEFFYDISNLSQCDGLEFIKEPVRLDYGNAEVKLIWSLHLKIFKNENFEEYLQKRTLSTSSTSSQPAIERKGSISSIASKQSTNISDIAETAFDSRSSTRSKSPESFIYGRSLQYVGEINMTLRYSLQRQRLIATIQGLS
ncbi:unnamed protein product [Acanthoscelides obtectus]|nr:unnamed protein product [Acanthoscelides obtectus]CAK1622741.1 Extended synaptotagmin-2 [Acanthoscelides obtectus]